MVSVKWTASALENLEELDPIIRDRVLLKVSWLESNFSTVVPEPLHQELKGLYKLRVGDYRVIYSAQRDAITIEMVGHRRSVYR